MNLREARNKRKMTQYQLSILAGLYHHTISNVENGKQYPKRQTRKAIETVLGCQVDWIKTRLQGVITAGFGEGDSPEEKIIKNIYEFIKSSQTKERPYKYEFLREIIKELELNECKTLKDK